MTSDDNQCIVLCVNYDGTHFFGFQMQAACRTVQAEIEEALYVLYSCKVRVHPSGRTDTGVHALRQYMHFLQPSLSKSRIPPQRLSYALNALLPSDVRVEYSRAVDDDFHARYSAISRIYCYSMHVSHTVFSPWRTVVATVSPCIQWNLWMRDASEFVGMRDFARFCKGAQELQKQGKSTVRTVEGISLVQEGDTMKFFIEANGFLWHMVRAIVGMLMYRASLSDEAYAKLPSIRAIFQSDFCNMRRRLAPAQGLYLYDVKYNKKYALPHNPVPPSQYDK